MCAYGSGLELELNEEAFSQAKRDNPCVCLLVEPQGTLSFAPPTPATLALESVACWF